MRDEGGTWPQEILSGLSERIAKRRQIQRTFATMYFDPTDAPLDAVLADVPIDENQRIGEGLDIMNYMTDIGGYLSKNSLVQTQTRGFLEDNWWAGEQQRSARADIDDVAAIASSGAAGAGRSWNECIVCFERMTLNDGHEHFHECGHGHLFCKGCAEKVDVCPMCRAIKPGREAAVAEEAERISNDPSFVSCNHTAARERSQQNTESVSVDVDMNPVEAEEGKEVPKPAQSPPSLALESSMSGIFGVSAPPSPVRELSASAWSSVDMSMVERAPSAERAIQNIETMLRSYAEAEEVQGNEMVLVERSPTPVAGSRQSLQLVPESSTPSPAVTSATLALGKDTLHSKRERGSSFAKGGVDGAIIKSDHISQKGNPFAKHKIKDSEVSDCSFTDFVSLMRWLKFTPEEVEEGKRFRKRLKNRKQVMSYSARKKNASSSLEKRNEFLEKELDQLTEQNASLTDKNTALNVQVREHENLRLAAEGEARALREQLEVLREALKK